jgi:DNA invertase Pin-like site-specific DNA recombinase
VTGAVTTGYLDSPHCFFHLRLTRG